MGWFPQEWANEYYFIRAVFALTAAVLLIVHMAHIWPETKFTQQSRYLVLLGYALVTTYASVDQLHSGAAVKSYNLMSGGLTLALIAVTIASMHDYRLSKRP